MKSGRANTTLTRLIDAKFVKLLCADVLRCVKRRNSKIFMAQSQWGCGEESRIRPPSLHRSQMASKQSTCSMTSSATTASKDFAVSPRLRQFNISPTMFAGHSRSIVTVTWPQARSLVANQPSPVPTSSTCDFGARCLMSRLNFLLRDSSLTMGLRSFIMLILLRPQYPWPTPRGCYIGKP